MNILIAGGTGMIGTEMIHYFKANGHSVKLLTRKKTLPLFADIESFIWNPYKMIFPAEALLNTDVIINLSGAGIVDKRWSKARKQELIDSRVIPLQCIRHALASMPHNVQHIISASGIGYYGNSGDAWVTEKSAPANEEFLVECCRAWEQAALDLESVCPRVTILRIGIVLHRIKGAYPRLVNPIRYGVMPLLDGGKPFYSWIHIADVAAIAEFIFIHKLAGVYNAVAPQPVRLKMLLNSFVENSPRIYIPVYVPAFGLKLILGQMGAAILNSNRVSAEKIIEAGFTFKYTTIQGAIKQLESI